MLNNKRIMSKTNKKDYWRIEIDDELVPQKFKSEKKAKKFAKFAAGKTWKERVVFYQYYWVPPQDGYYGEECYSF